MLSNILKKIISYLISSQLNQICDMKIDTFWRIAFLLQLLYYSFGNNIRFFFVIAAFFDKRQVKPHTLPFWPTPSILIFSEWIYKRKYCNKIRTAIRQKKPNEKIHYNILRFFSQEQNNILYLSHDAPSNPWNERIFRIGAMSKEIFFFLFSKLKSNLEKTSSSYPYPLPHPSVSKTSRANIPVSYNKVNLQKPQITKWIVFFGSPSTVSPV